jgi:hypothetical protein
MTGQSNDIQNDIRLVKNYVNRFLVEIDRSRTFTIFVIIT